MRWRIYRRFAVWPYRRMILRVPLVQLIRPYGPYGRYGLHPDVQPELHAARPPHGRPAEEHALQQVLVVEHVLDVDLGSHDLRADDQRVPRARVEDEARLHLDRPVEVEEPGSVGRVGTIAVGEAGAVDGGGADEEPLAGIQ